MLLGVFAKFINFIFVRGFVIITHEVDCHRKDSEDAVWPFGQVSELQSKTLSSSS